MVVGEDSGVGIYTSVSVFSGAGLEVQKEKAIGVVRVTRSYRSDVEEGMLHLRVSSTFQTVSYGNLVHSWFLSCGGRGYCSHPVTC